MKKRYKHTILHEDEDIIIVNKPPYIAVIPERNQEGTKSLKEVLLKGREEVFVVHRLDKNTSGVLIMAKNKEAHRTLSMAFQEREIDKRYHGIVYGRPLEDQGVINASISSIADKTGKYTIYPRGKKCVTEYRLIEELGHNYYLLEFHLITGRAHQIRIHCAHAGFPLAVDHLYGHEPAFHLSSIKRKYKLGKFNEEYPLLARNSLHARHIKFKHPTSGEMVEFTAPFFKDYKAMLNQLNKFL